MTVEEVKREVNLFTLEIIKNYPVSRSLREDFYTMWHRFGPQAARDYMIPAVWNGKCPRPSEYLNV